MSFTPVNISASISEQTGQAHNNNALAFCVDDRYLPYALFVATQFIEKHPVLPCDICICMPDISKVPQDFHGGNIRFIEISIEGISEMPIGQLSLAAYYRLFLPKIFQDTYEYILYLDADTYINRPFYDEILYCISNFKSEFCIAAAADISELQIRLNPTQKLKKIEKYVSSYHEFNHIYRNSGVLVFNTDKYNKYGILEKIFSYANDNIEKLQCHDQSALNGALINNIELLPFNFNWQMHKLTYDLTESVNPYIIHFISENKPWSLDNYLTKNYQQLYISFLNKYFPSMNYSILTTEQKRIKSPKYSNPIREFISINNERLKKNLSKKNRKNHSNLEKIKLTKEVLVNLPFMLFTDHDAINNN